LAAGRRPAWAERAAGVPRPGRVALDRHRRMSIVRAPRPERYTVLGNQVINDDQLSYRALGVLTFLLSKPDDWRTDSETLARPGKREGRDAIRSALRELERAGYLRRTRRQEPRTGRWVTESHVYDTPTDDGFPVVGNPTTGEPNVGEPNVGEPGPLP